MKTIFSLIVALATLLFVPGFNNSTASNMQPPIPANAVRAGQESDGRPIYVCIATALNGRYREYPDLTDTIPGKYTGGQCLYTSGSFERAATNFRVLTSSTRLTWAPPHVIDVPGTFPENRQELGGGFWAGTANYRTPLTGRRYQGKLYSCRGNVGGGVHAGFAYGSGGRCYIPYGGRAEVVTNFEVLSDPSISFSYWTDWHSEESPQPLTCQPGFLVSGFGCRDRFCDNARLKCTQKGMLPLEPFWTRFISEEKDGTCLSFSGIDRFDCNFDMLSCGPDDFLTGVRCSGDFCDSIRMQCTGFERHTRTGRGGCRWTDWVSEEGSGTIEFPTGYYAAGMQCAGSNCDNKRFYICRLAPTRR